MWRRTCEVSARREGSGSFGYTARPFGYTARPPPPVVLPAAACASLCLGGALRRASPFGLALPRMCGCQRQCQCQCQCQCQRQCQCQCQCQRQFWLHRPPTPTRNPPCRGMRFAVPWRRVAPGFALRARAAAGGWGGVGCWVGCVVWFGYTARPPPPVVLPAAACASLCLGGALRRASPFGLALPRMCGCQCQCQARPVPVTRARMT